MTASAGEGERVLLGLDLGGTLIKAARFSADGTLQAKVSAGSPADEGAESILKALCGAAASLLEGRPLAGAGIGAAGVIDPAAGRIVESPNLPALSGFLLGERVREALGGVPVHLMNDANAAALGEYHAGAAADAESMFILTLGTGIGGGFVAGGRIWEGVASVGGEAG
ncbi:MAG: ROK family protein, partial [bacterium]